MAERAGLRTFIRRLPITTIVAAILALVAAISLAQRLPAISHRYDQFDFTVFYGWWSDYSSGGDPWTDMRGPMHGCNQPPSFVETFSPLARLDRKTAFWIWQAAQFLCVVAAVLLLARGNDPPLGAAPTIIVLSLVLMSRPFAGAMVWSQIAPMLLALLCAAWFCAREESPAAAGMFLALAALLKLFPAGAAGYFLFGRRWRALGWTIGFFVAGVLLTNPVHWIELVTHGLPISYQRRGARGTHRAVCGAKSRSALRRTTSRRAGHRSLGNHRAHRPRADRNRRRRHDNKPRTRRSRWSRVRNVGRARASDVAACLDRRDPAAVAFVLVRAASRMAGFPVDATPRREHRLIAGGATLVICIVTEVIKAVPHPGFPMLLAAYLAAALILRARTRSDSARAEAAKIPA